MPTFRNLASFTGLFAVAVNAAVTSTLTTTTTACRLEMSCGQTSTTTAAVTKTTTVTKVSCSPDQHCSSIPTTMPGRPATSFAWQDQSDDHLGPTAGTGSTDSRVGWTTTSAYHTSVTKKEAWSDASTRYHRSDLSSSSISDAPLLEWTIPSSTWDLSEDVTTSTLALEYWTSSTSVATTKSPGPASIWEGVEPSTERLDNAAATTTTARSQFVEDTMTFSSLARTGASAGGSMLSKELSPTPCGPVSAYTGSASKAAISDAFKILSILTGGVSALSVLQIF